MGGLSVLYHHPGAEERSGDRDVVEPLLVQGRNPLFEIETRHRSLLLT